MAASEIQIAAAPEAVWEVLTALERWPSWNRDVKSVSVRGPVTAGSVFRWKPGLRTITSTIEFVEAPRRIVWTGRTLGLKTKHFWRLEPRGGGTSARAEESFESRLARLLILLMKRRLEGKLAHRLQSLKAEVERRTPD